MHLIFLVMLLCMPKLLAEESSQLSTEEKIAQFSEFIGYAFVKELRTAKIDYDAESIIRGIKFFEDGLLPKSSCDEMGAEFILQIQEELFDKKAALNKVRVEEFFQNIAKNPTIVKVVDNQLYYEILNKGTGTETVKETSCPLLHYSADTFEDVKIANTFDERTPISIPLTDTISGFVKGVVGMKEGERRKLYIHPELAYKRGGMLPPNSLLIFDVEVIKTNAPEQKKKEIYK